MRCTSGMAGTLDEYPQLPTLSKSPNRAASSVRKNSRKTKEKSRRPTKSTSASTVCVFVTVRCVQSRCFGLPLLALALPPCFRPFPFVTSGRTHLHITLQSPPLATNSHRTHLSRENLMMHLIKSITLAPAGNGAWPCLPCCRTLRRAYIRSQVHGSPARMTGSNPSPPPSSTAILFYSHPL